MAAACLEYAVELRWFPWLQVAWVTHFGVCCVVIGEVIRKAGIVTAGSGFTQRIQSRRRPQHRLVTWGIYKFIRHPGYAGWILWAMGTQLILCNPMCTVLFAGVVRSALRPAYLFFP
jgi:protein-S-isoprenylcysteine O-methyltransferase